MIKGSIQQEGVTFVNISAPKIGEPKYMKQILTDLKGETDSNTITEGDFSTTLTLMGRPSKQKIKKETQVLNHTLDEMDLIDIFSSFHPNTKNTPSSQVHMEHILQDRPYLGSQIKPQ